MSNELMTKVIVALKKTLNISQERVLAPITRLREDLGLDSMTSLTFLMTLEEMIEGFIIDPEKLDMRDLESIQSITQYVVRQVEVTDYEC